ncbi:MAG: hypothetical protein U0802_17815 [Candidatus Binatia bacterium]
MWSGVSDDVLVPEPALPSQFGDIWHRSRAISPERALALAVLWEAVFDLQKFRFATRRRQQRLYWEAYEWVASSDRRWPYSFVNLCELLALNPVAVRQQLLGAMAPLARDEFLLSEEIVEAA